jgi:hypothetical protein
MRTVVDVFERGLPPRSRRWLDALRPDADLAEAEGLAAGLGLLTGQVARSTARTSAPVANCPGCGGSCVIVVLDLVGRSSTRKCTSCARRWTTDDDDASVVAIDGGHANQ